DYYCQSADDNYNDVF
nr:immunoglobulin light chain junction region [Macaca mulatta]MOY15548.1 immunoglobulin light chain junction region [Macaca mulatta]MOY16089.1 immunoglobulin light chain junction region [Macaca mulatta]MOY16457.1 immunoglobulin light chain junction region [Macaca mulatta]MOY17459.1 immunoglobulin light chain junction region [Macaca mulatta]